MSKQEILIQFVQKRLHVGIIQTIVLHVTTTMKEL